MYYSANKRDIFNSILTRMERRDAERAAEYGVPFIDYNLMYEELGMDFSADMADDGHLNAPGAAKFTSYFGNYLSEHYDIPDHRGEEAYETWEKDADYIYKRLEQAR